MTLNREIQRIRTNTEKSSWELEKLKVQHQEQEELVRDLARKLKEVRHDNPHLIHNEEMEPKVKSIVDSNSACINQFIIDERGRV